jgi:hypothetical protein
MCWQFYLLVALLALYRFELRGCYIAYFDKEGGKLKGDIPLAEAIDIQDSTADDAKAFELEIKMADRIYRLNCADGDDREEWIAALLGARDSAKAARDAMESESNPLDDATPTEQQDAEEGIPPEQEQEQEPEPEPEPEPRPQPQPQPQMQTQTQTQTQRWSWCCRKAP